MIRRHSHHVNIQCPLPVQAKIYVIGVVGEGQLRFILGSCETLSLRGPPEALSASSLGFLGFPRARGMASQSVCCRDLFLTEHCSEAHPHGVTAAVRELLCAWATEGRHLRADTAPHGGSCKSPCFQKTELQRDLNLGLSDSRAWVSLPPRSPLHLSEQHSEALWSGCRPRPQICFFPEGRDVSHPGTS